jgi:hypothetical protein
MLQTNLPEPRSVSHARYRSVGSILPLGSSFERAGASRRPMSKKWTEKSHVSRAKHGAPTRQVARSNLGHRSAPSCRSVSQGQKVPSVGIST